MRGEAEVSDDHCDALMAELEEMAGGHGAGLDVVAADGSLEGDGRNAVDVDDGITATKRSTDGGGIDAAGEQNTVHASGKQGVEVVGLASRILVRIAEEDAVAGLAGDVFDAANDLWVEGVGDVWDDDAEGVGFSGFEAAGDGVGEVV